MNTIISITVHIILLFITANAENPKTFPKDFSFGTGSSAYQIEGSWNLDGKSENIWDHWIHSDPSHIKGNRSADVACDAYKNYYMDIYYLNKIQVQHYQFSIPWSRILPSGFSNQINMKAVIHYQHIIKMLRAAGITPIATLYHHDLPQSLQDIGGWENPDMAKYFADYARACFQYFHDVDYWITFNDPRATCRYGYGEGSYAPGIASDGVGEYTCAYTVLKAHAAAYHVYKEEFPKLKGKVSIALDLRWSEPATPYDEAAVERRNAFEFGLYAHPIYKANWPDEVIERVDYRSKNENYTKPRLPKFTSEEIHYINGTSDFMAINIFFANIVEDVEEAEFGDPSYTKDMKVKIYMNSSWELAENGQPIVPASARASLVWLQSSFNDPEILITGNGVADNSFYVDETRINFLRDYLSAILDAININGVKVFGYTAWSLYEQFEWTDGYSYNFGFYHYDIDKPGRYKEKSSALFYYDLIHTSTIPEQTTTTPGIPVTTPDSATKILLCPVLVLAIVLLLQLYSGYNYY